MFKPNQIEKAKKNHGFVSLITVIVISAIILSVGLTISLLGVNELLFGFIADQSHQALQMADACTEEAYFRLKKNSSYTGGTLSLGGGSCTATVTGSGTTRTITVSATVGNFTRRITTNVTLTSNAAGNTEGIDLTHWEES